MSAIPKEAPIDKRRDAMGAAIDQAFDFVRAAIDVPGLLDHFPDKGTLATRQFELDGHSLLITAIQGEGESNWVARPSRYALKAGASVFQRPIPGVPDDPGDLIGRTLAIVEMFRVSSNTSTGALDALEAKLRAAINEALRVDLAETGRRG